MLKRKEIQKRIVVIAIVLMSVSLFGCYQNNPTVDTATETPEQQLPDNEVDSSDAYSQESDGNYVTSTSETTETIVPEHDESVDTTLESSEEENSTDEITEKAAEEAPLPDGVDVSMMTTRLSEEEYSDNDRHNLEQASSILSLLLNYDEQTLANSESFIDNIKNSSNYGMALETQENNLIILRTRDNYLQETIEDKHETRQLLEVLEAFPILSTDRGYTYHGCSITVLERVRKTFPYHDFGIYEYYNDEKSEYEVMLDETGTPFRVVEHIRHIETMDVTDVLPDNYGASDAG